MKKIIFLFLGLMSVSVHARTLTVVNTNGFGGRGTIIVRQKTSNGNWVELGKISGESMSGDVSGPLSKSWSVTDAPFAVQVEYPKIMQDYSLVMRSPFAEKSIEKGEQDIKVWYSKGNLVDQDPFQRR